MSLLERISAKQFWWIPAIILTVTATVLELHRQGRSFICACGYVLVWFGDAWAAGTSQHLLDPYSFTHLLHGFVLCGLLMWRLPRWRFGWQLWLAVAVECCWEMLENSDPVILRYRSQTAALGYLGDSVVNSLGDILTCALGFALARRLGFRRSLVGFAVIELTMLFLYRDSLILNIIMLLFPIEALRMWQAGH